MKINYRQLLPDRILIISIALSFVLTMTVGAVVTIRDGQKIRETLVRFHVIANSDSTADQELKMAVRDRIVDEAEQITAGAVDSSDALIKLNSAIPFLTELAKEVITEENYDYDVKIVTGSRFFPTKSYGNITLPAGEYQALSVYIGEAKGQNFWCVLFPPLCTSFAMGKSEETLLSSLTPEQSVLVTNAQNKNVQMKFKFIEWIELLKAKKK